MKQNIKTIFWSLIGVSILILAQFFIPGVSDFIVQYDLFLVPFIVFSVLGAYLIFLTLKENIQGKLKKTLLITGVSAAGFFVAIFLHNAFYAFAILATNINWLKLIMEALHVIFFFLAIPIFPILFVVGVITTLSTIKKHEN